MAVFAVRTVHYPTNGEHAGNPNEVDRDKKIGESLWAPSTYEPITTLTLALVLVAIGQAALFVWQLSLIQAGAKDAASAANAALKSADTAEKALVATFRPKLVVKRISLEEPRPGRPLKIEWIVANIGGTPGTITESNATVKLSGPKILEPIPEYSDEKTSMGSLTVEPGTGVPLAQFDSESLREWQDDAHAAGQAFVYFIGYIQYADGIGVRRYMAFCRRYNRQTRRFEVVDDPNYEYGD
jgi:hypothetical protein